MTHQSSFLELEAEAFSNQPSKYLPWLTCFSAALFFFYVVLQLTVFNTISIELMRDFAIQTPTLSKLSASYLYMASLFFIPAGLLFDRFSTRKLLIVTCLLCTLGTAVIALTSSLSLAFLGRILVGISNPFAFLGPMRLANRWFSRKQSALIIGLIVTVGMSGGIVSQSPFTLLMHATSWRTAMLLNAGLGVLITLMMSIFVKDTPDENYTTQETASVNANLLHKLKLSFRQPQNWLCGFYTGLMNLPLAVLGALWGVLYLTQTKNFSAVAAGNLISFIFVGLMCGPPLIGAISDRIGKRKLPMIVSAILILLTTLLIIYYSPPFYILAFLFLMLGLFSGAQTMSYPLVIASNPVEIESTSLGLVSFLVNAIGVIAQMLFAWLITLHWDEKIIDGVPVYSSFNFKFAFLVLIIGFALSTVISIFIRESKTTQGIPS